MIYKIKEIFLLFFLILLQSCSGGTIGNFLELSFDNLENINRTENSESILKNKKEVKNNIEIQKKENSKSILKNKKEVKKNIEIQKEENSKSILKNKKEVKKNIEIQKEENSKSVLKNKKVFNSEKKSEEAKKTKKVNKSNKKRKNELQTYKIIFILKDVDPKDPIEELSTILRNSDVNFEIEKIERFLDSKKNYE